MFAVFVYEKAFAILQHTNCAAKKPLIINTIARKHGDDIMVLLLRRI